MCARVRACVCACVRVCVCVCVCVCVLALVERAAAKQLLPYNEVEEEIKVQPLSQHALIVGQARAWHIQQNHKQ